MAEPTVGVGESVNGTENPPHNQKRNVVDAGGGAVRPHRRRLPRHSPHPPICFAVGWVYADGPLAVLHGPRVIPQFAVGGGSRETKQGVQSCGPHWSPTISHLWMGLGFPICKVGWARGCEGVCGL